VKRCGICKQSYRGAGRKVVTRDGAARACPTCATKTVRVFTGDAATACTCGQPATTCTPCANVDARRDRAAVVAGAVRKLRGMAKAYRDLRRPPGDHDAHAETSGRMAALEQAADILESGEW